MSQLPKSLTLIPSCSESSLKSDVPIQRLEPMLLRGAENDDVELLGETIECARKTHQLNQEFLLIGLMRSSEKNKFAATKYLLDQGAQSDEAIGKAVKRLSPLLRAVERNNIEIVQLLLKYGANPDTADKKGRTALMTAAWRNHWHILNLLIHKGASINAQDHKGRNVLHNLAADKKCDWGDSVIELLLSQDISIDGERGQDGLGRTPLHWTCATGKINLTERLLTRNPKANLHAIETRGKTALHLAVSNNRQDIVNLLLKYGAHINAKSDGGWTPLHNALEIESEKRASAKILRMLISHGADPNAKLLNGMTPLHIAAQNGNILAVKYLLEQPGIKSTVRDSFGCTPFLRAAKNKRKDIVNLLAPFNHPERLCRDGLGACHGFNATIVDFGNFRNGNRVQKPSVFELLYDKDPSNKLKPKHSILSTDKAASFRWIHLPANNVAWVEVLLTKLFVEENVNDIESFRSLEDSLSYQHRGQKSHSHFMRSFCQSAPRGSEKDGEILPMSSSPRSSSVLLNERQHVTPSNGSQLQSCRDPHKIDTKDSNTKVRLIKDDGKPHIREKGNKPKAKSKLSRDIDITSKTETHHPRSSGVASKVASQPKSTNIFTFMPYIHFESHHRQLERQKAISRAETLHSSHFKNSERAGTFDEMLIRAHLSKSNVSLHPRRTLDQSFYHNIDTKSRDQDQVVYRYQLKSSSSNDGVDPKILMVDQLWMWILGKDLIVTLFPQSWQQPKNDPLNVLDSVIEDINSKIREPVASVYDLSMIITKRCTSIFNRYGTGDNNYQFLDMFESSIGSVTDRENILFKEFNMVSAQASAWLRNNRQSSWLSRYLSGHTTDTHVRPQIFENEVQWEEIHHNPIFVDKLLDIGQETDLLAEVKDIRDELNMIAKILEDQLHVLPDFQEAICDSYVAEHKSQAEVKKRFRDMVKLIEVHNNDIARMDRQAERIYKSITDMLDLKQKHANALEARFTRDQAAGTARQSQTIMVFTIVTIIFLPLSFIATFFAINIREFPRGIDGPGIPLGYVSKYLFGVGFTVSLPLIAVALLVDDISIIFRQAKAILRRPRGREEQFAATPVHEQHVTERVASTERCVYSEELERMHLQFTGDHSGSVMSDMQTVTPTRKMITGFRIRASRDLEQGSL
ncbi:BgTH12-04164 [Blumeria graminis f. sp. triticale]|uniref:BgTH12-04164 n=1 Tax=Blumeria graminis f. sp. triticale TaxID=1689686 RepID=A0A9W4CWX1_BLUGR|nr:BgTH12-04164 [Blumeria graminis f. sp. triticale]